MISKKNKRKNNKNTKKNNKILLNINNTQIDFLIYELNKRYDKIINHKSGNKNVGLVYETYNLSKKMILNNIDKKILKKRFNYSSWWYTNK